MIDFVKDIFGDAKESLKDKGLDKTRKALGELKENLKLSPQKALQRVQAAFGRDLDELNITDKTKRADYWDKVDDKLGSYLEAAKQRTVEQSSEFKNLKGFTENLENLAGLKAMIEAESPEKKAAGWFGALRDKLGVLAAPLVMWLNGAAEEDSTTGEDGKKKYGFWGKMYQKIAGWLEPEAEKEKQAEALAKGKENAEKPTWGAKVQAWLEQFKVNGKPLDPKFSETQYGWLQKMYSPALIEQLASKAKMPNSNTQKIYKAIQEATGKHSVSLFDIRFEHKALKKVKPIVDIINGATNATTQNLSKFLNAIDVEKAGKKRLKQLAKDTGLKLKSNA